MALQMEFTKDEVTYTPGYLIISSISINNTDSYIFLNFFSDKANYESGLVYVDQKIYIVQTSYFDSGNVIELAYQHLLSLPEFSTAVQVS